MDIAAHTAMHGSAIGYLAGCWLGSDAKFDAILTQYGGPLLPVSQGDFGE